MAQNRRAGRRKGGRRRLGPLPPYAALVMGAVLGALVAMGAAELLLRDGLQAPGGEEVAAARIAVAPPPLAKPAPPGRKPGAPPDWRRYARPAQSGSGPFLAVVIDDLGHDPALTRRAVRLPPDVALAFLPYAPGVRGQVAVARKKGFEVLVHLPMEPDEAHMDPGPNALYGALDNRTLLRRLDANLSVFPGYIGVNNHMGSRFTRDAGAMTLVLTELRRRGLLFLDSRTSPDSVGASIARELEMPWAGRDVFLDNSREPADIRRQLAEAERRARETGLAVAIGHPYPETLDLLEEWLPEAASRGLELVPISQAAAASAAVAGFR